MCLSNALATQKTHHSHYEDQRVNVAFTKFIVIIYIFIIQTLTQTAIYMKITIFWDMLCAAVSVDRHQRFGETSLHELDGRTVRCMKPTAVSVCSCFEDET